MSAAKQVTLEGLDEPWKDADTLRTLYEDRTQAEVAEYLSERGHDVTASTISHWMKKLEVNTTHTNHEEPEERERRKCEYYGACGNETAGINTFVCDSCMDLAEERTQRGFTAKRYEEELLGNEFTTMTEHMEHLYNE